MTTHSKLSPSARHRWGVCPASVREEAKYPERPGGAAAIDGTHSHTLLEKCINDGKTASEFVGQTLKDHDGEFKVDADRAERVQFALDYVSGCVGTVISERRVHPDSLVGRDDMSGTVDIQVVADDNLEIIDYKDGMNPVVAKDNHQMEQYAVGAIAEMHTQGKLAPLYVTCTIIQPKLRMKGLSGIDSHTYTLGELMVIKGKLIAEAAATDAPDAPFNPGESQCKYCAHGGACTARTTQALSNAGISFANLEVVEQTASKEPTTMTDKQLREVLEAAPLLRQMIEAAETEALRRFEAGQEIDGLKAVRGRGSRSWMYEDDAMEEHLKKAGIPKSAIYKTTMISPAQIEKVRWSKRDGTVCQVTPAKLLQLQETCVKKSDGKIQIVASADPRPSVTLSAAALFGAVSSDLPSFLL